jgi:protein-histidine pros-kinase
MDGYEATIRIRQRESRPDWQHPPVRIIAMTANAMAGEKERCLSVGMDDYLTKPLRADALMEALSKVNLSSDDIGADDFWSAKDEADASQQIRQLADELSVEAAAELLGNWLDDTPSKLEELMILAAGGDQHTLRRAAHSLKGSCSLFGLNRIYVLSRDLESLAEQQKLQGQTTLATKLMQAFDAAEPYLRSEIARMQ